VHFSFVVQPIKNTQQTRHLSCTRNKAHRKDFNARQRWVFP
jgi:hypothetical protein